MTDIIAECILLPEKRNLKRVKYQIERRKLQSVRFKIEWPSVRHMYSAECIKYLLMRKRNLFL
jgi:hypothetical protein